jgi:chromosome segregation ATPase
MAILMFTDEQIITAGKKIEAAGKKVNGWSLRTELAGGKPKRMFEIWKAATQSTDIVNTADDYNAQLPSEVQDSVRLLTGDIVKQFEDAIILCNNIATKTADKRVASTIEDMKRSIASAEETEIEANSVVDKCDEAIQKLEDDIESITSNNNKLSNTIAKLETKNEDLSSNEKSAKARITELEKLLSQSNAAKSESDMKAAGLEQTNKIFENQSIASQRSLSLSEQNNATLVAQNSEITKQLNNAITEKADADNQLTETRINLATETGKLSEQRSNISDLKSDFQSQAEQLIDANERVDALVIELQVAKVELKALNVALQ